MFSNFNDFSHDSPWLSTRIQILVLAVVAAFLIHNAYVYLRLWRIPGPLSCKLTDLPRLLWVVNGDAHYTHIDLHRKYGKLVRFGPNMVSVSDPAEISHIYGITQNFKKSNFYRALSFFVKGKAIPGLFATQDETLHRHLKRPIAGMYSMTSVVAYEPFVESTVRVLFEQFDKRFVEQDNVCDLGAWLQMFAFDVVGEITFSKRLGFLESGEDVDNIMANGRKYFSQASIISQMPWLDFVWSKNPILQQLKGAKMNPIVAFAKARRQEREGKVGEKIEEERALPDFLTRFMEVEKKHAETPPWAVSAWSTSNISAGSDTTAIMLRTIVYNLMKYPETLKALHKELDSRTDLDEIITWKQAISLPYLDACIKEAGRMHPPFSLPYERVVPPEGADICGEHIPGGTVVGISAWVAHRDYETFGDDCDVWRPERWIECDATHRRKMESTLLTFGFGHRSCIGKNISYLEVYKLIPTLFREYDFEFAVKDGAEYRVQNRWFSYQDGLNVRVNKRSKV